MHSPSRLNNQQTNHRILLVGAILLVASMASSVRAQDTPASESKYFKMVGTVRFDKPDTLLIAAIDHIDVDPSGRWLITDRLGDQVLLFDSTGTLQASLDSSICHPGFTFSPDGAMFGPNGFIFVLNTSNHWGYRFTTDGKCLGSVDRDFVMPKYFDIDPAGALYVAYDGPHWELRHMNATGKTLRELPLPQSKFPNASERFNGGGLIADGTHLFYASGPDTEILKFALDGTLLQRISARNSWFRSPSKDLPSDVSQLFEALKDWSATSARIMFELTDQTLMIQYIHRERGTGYQVFTKDGKLVAEEFGLNYLFLHGEDGLVYRPYQLDLDSQGELPNPYLEVYRFVAP